MPTPFNRASTPNLLLARDIDLRETPEHAAMAHVSTAFGSFEHGHWLPHHSKTSPPPTLALGGRQLGQNITQTQ